MKHLILGLSYEDVKQNISKPFSVDQLQSRGDNNGQKYFPHEVLQERFDTFIGDNYYFNVLEAPRLIPLQGNDKSLYYVSALVELLILDDDGIMVTRLSAPGVDQVILFKETGIPKNLENSFKSALKRAKRNCIKDFIGPSAFAKNYTDSHRNQSTASTTNVDLRLTEGFTKYEKRFASKVELDGHILPLIVWESMFESIGKDKIDVLLKLKKDSVITCTVKRDSYNNQPRLVLQSLISRKKGE